MGMFNVRKPRGFNHQYIYVDERKEKLAKMEEDAKRDLGILPCLFFCGIICRPAVGLSKSYKLKQSKLNLL